MPIHRRRTTFLSPSTVDASTPRRRSGRGWLTSTPVGAPAPMPATDGPSLDLARLIEALNRSMLLSHP